jgi:hypothetical protein
VKVDDGAVQAKSVMGRSPPIANGGQGGRGGCRGARTAGEEERKGRKEMGVAHGGAAISYRRVEVGDDRRGGATRQARLRERERERAGVLLDRKKAGGRQQPEVGRHERRGAAMPRGRLDRGEGGADRRARMHSAVRLHRLIGGPGCTVSDLNKF